MGLASSGHGEAPVRPEQGQSHGHRGGAEEEGCATPPSWGRPDTRLRVSLHTQALPAGCWSRAPWDWLGHQQHTGPLARSGPWGQVGGNGRGVRLCRSGDGRPHRWEGLWHKRWHPGFQGPRQGAMSLPALRGETGERCAGSQGPERVSTKLMRQAGRQAPGRSGGTVPPMSKAQCSAQPLDSPVPVGSPLVPKGFRVGKCLRLLSAHHLFQRKQLMPGPRAGSGGVGVWAKGLVSGEAHGKQGEEAATDSWAAQGLPGRPPALTHLSSEAARAPSRCSCARCDLSPLGHRRAGTAQKMLCRRFFPRPGCWKARPR